ncbi:MAG TPA: ATP-binding protein [Saprospiraceae bacterium]|nr:ATP-binding protein [Saprospiraceae bacterium]
MEKTEIILFILLFNLILIFLIGSVIYFVYQYRKRKIIYDNEKVETSKKHKLELLKAQVDGQEQTMQFIAREIHDNVTQKLTLASLYSQMMDADERLHAFKENIQPISHILESSLVELRSLSKALIDNSLQQKTIGELILEETRIVNSTGMTYVSAHIEDHANLSVEMKSNLFRVVQEFIQNSLKHAQAKKIEINLTRKNHQLCLSLRDDGKGFDMNTSMEKGMGLNNMKRRIESLNGSFELISKKDEGTTMIILLSNPT